MAPFFASKPQEANIAAAITWHAQFPAEAMAPAAYTFFQEGVLVQEGDVSLGFGKPWIGVRALTTGPQYQSTSIRTEAPKGVGHMVLNA